MKAYISPQRWRDRAEEARIQAERMRDHDTKRMMLEVAAGYDRMAARAEAHITTREVEKE